MIRNYLRDRPHHALSKVDTWRPYCNAAGGDAEYKLLMRVAQHNWNNVQGTGQTEHDDTEQVIRSLNCQF